MAFIAPILNLKEELEPPKYVHGFSDSQVEEIKLSKAKIEERDLGKEPVTREEFKNIIVPWQRIHRVTEFILHPVKEKKEKVVRVAKPKIVKVKKLTKKQIKEKMENIVFKMAVGEELSEEEAAFLGSQNEDIL